MVTADYYNPTWVCLVDIFCNLGLKNWWYGQPGIESTTLDLNSHNQVPLNAWPWQPLPTKNKTVFLCYFFTLLECAQKTYGYFCIFSHQFSLINWYLHSNTHYYKWCLFTPQKYSNMGAVSKNILVLTLFQSGYVKHLSKAYIQRVKIVIKTCKYIFCLDNTLFAN